MSRARDGTFGNSARIVVGCACDQARPRATEEPAAVETAACGVLPLSSSCRFEDYVRLSCTSSRSTITTGATLTAASSGTGTTTGCDGSRATRIAGSRGVGLSVAP